MNNKEFKANFMELAKKYGFESAYGGWFKTSSECIFVFDLMKSNFGNYYQLNIKVFVNGVFGKNYHKSKELAKKLIGNIFRAEPKEFEEALNLENKMNEEDRLKKLEILFAEFLVPFAEKALTRYGLDILEKSNHIFILPSVRKEMDRLANEEI